MLHQVGKDHFKLDQQDLGWYTRVLGGGIPGIKELRRKSNDALLDVQVHRSHLPLFPPKMLPTEIVSPRPRSWSVHSPKPLRDYQEEAVAFARERAGAAFFHDLGLGKNFMIFPAMDYPALAVCPTSALQVWEKEAHERNLDVQVHHGRDAKLDSISHEADVHLTTYGSMNHWLPLFNGRGRYPKVHSVAIDEAHGLHKKASRYHSALASVRRESTIVMTATPARNRLRSLHGLLHAIATSAFGSLTDFRIRYAGADRDAYGHYADGPELTNMDELAARLTEVAIAETWLSPRVQHLRPPLRRQTIEVDIPFDQRVRSIEDAIGRSFNKLKTAGSPNASHIAYMTAQRIELGKLKARWFLDSCADHLLEKHKRLIVWCWHKEVLRPIAEELRQRCRRPLDIITGEAPSTKRRKVVNEWEYGDPNEERLLLATLGSMSTAVNLTTAEAAAYVEMSWAPLDLQQAEARHHRPGSHFDEVFAYYAVVPGMIDGHMASVLLEKIEHTEQALGQCSQKDQMLALLGGHQLEGIF